MQMQNWWVINIESILQQVASVDQISDIHLSAWEHLCVRLNWSIQKVSDRPKLTSETLELIMKQLMKWNQKAFEQFIADREADFSFLAADWTSYRVNAFFKLGKLWVVMRKINSKSKHLEDLLLPEFAQSVKERILTQHQWLFLVTWPTGSWKSTTLVSMIEYLNETKPAHIITIEDPIEFVYEPKQAIISQREVWHDTWAFLNALRASMREDPDIILVWEIRDKETAEAALNLAETWHLVFSTLHTPSAAGTINRFISFFTPEIQDSIADRLWESLLWVQSQRLVKTADWKWRLWMFEIMINTPAVKNNIKKRQIPQIDNIIETWAKSGMITLQQYTKKMVEAWKVNEETVSWILNAKAA